MPENRPGFGPIRPRHVAMLLTLAMIWGTSFFVIKIGLTDMTALQLVAVRLVVGAAAMLIAAIIMRSALPPTFEHWIYAFFMALFGNSLPFFLISWGEESIDSGLAAILMAVMPLTTLLLAHFFAKGDRLAPRKLVGILCGFMGVIVLVGPAALAGLGDQVVRQIATAGGAVCYAISVIVAARMPPSSVIGRTAAVLLLSVVQTAPLALWLSGGELPPLTFDTLWPSVYLGLFPTAFAMLVLFKLVEEREPSFIAFQNYLVPVFGVLWGALLLSEPVTLNAVIALILILFGIFLANRTPRAAAKLGETR